MKKGWMHFTEVTKKISDMFKFSEHITKPTLSKSLCFFSRGAGVSSFFPPSPVIQTKLTHKPNDEYNQEVGVIADKIMGVKKSQLPLNPPSITPVQRKCAHCEEEEKMQRKEINTEETGAENGLTNYVNNLGNTGHTLPDEVRNYYEPRFGYDFSKIKVHTDAAAAESAQSVNALAYTSGNNIVFNKGQYSPQTDSGKRLLAHELTHTIQQSSTGSLIQRACVDDFTRYTGETCRGTIHVGATTISPAIAGYYHLFILYTDSTGARFYLRGSPGRGGEGYGNIVVSCAPYVEGEIEYDTRNLLEQVHEGADACSKLRTMRSRLNEIESWNVPYVPAGPNSNSVIATLLRASGLSLRKPAVPTPGFEMEVTASGGNPIQQDRPTLFLVSLGGGSGLLLNAEVQQRLHTFSPVIGGGIPIPIPLDLTAGLYSFPDQGRVGGSVGVGTSLSLINLPLPVFSPLGIVLGAGITAGASRRTDATGASTTTPEIGGYGRAGIYTDINRIRISPTYQYNLLYDTATGAVTNAHSFVVQLGYTF